MCKVALITGITGQDGSYLAEFLLTKNYHVWGIIRKSSASNHLQYIDHILDNITLRYGDLSEGTSFSYILKEIKEKYSDLTLEIYNLGALTHVGLSFEMPEYTGNVNGLGVLRLLEVIRLSGYTDKIKFYQASTSELFGKVMESPQTEKTPFYPRSPYGVAKLYGYWIVKNYRESYNMFACNGILMNHESPRRDEIFVTRKITKGIADIINGKKEYLVLGNLDASRDWGHAKDYVRGMWLMLQQEKPDDYLLSTNKTHTIRSFVEKAFALKNINITWRGEGLNEIGYDGDRKLIVISEEFFRPSEVDYLLGDCTKAQTKLGWTPEYTFDQLVEDMVHNDCK